MTDGPEWTDIRRWNKQICGVTNTNGWSRCHRFTLKHLKDFGFGRAGLEGVIQGEVNIIVNNKFTIEELKHHCMSGLPWSIVSVYNYFHRDNKGWGSCQSARPTWWERLQNGNGLLPKALDFFLNPKNSGVWDPCDQRSLDDRRWTTIQLQRPKGPEADGTP